MSEETRSVSQSNEREVLPPAFFPVSLNVTARRCVVIGPPGDREGDEKEEALRACGADVARIDPGNLRDADVRDAFFVISTPQDEALSQRLRALADAHRFLLCCIDQPRYGFVAMQAVVASGRARIAISTGGVSPRVGAVVRAALERALDGRFAAFLERLAVRRREVRAAHPEDSERRRATMRAAAEGFEVDVQVRYPAWYDAEGEAGLMPSVEIVTIGTELLLGHIVDTNSVLVARTLADHGVDVFAKHSVGDNAERLARMLAGVLERADGAITTGGLGPTVDDLTKDAVAQAVGDTLQLHEPSLAALHERFRGFGRPMTENNRKQAILPSRADVFPNPHGTAPGFVATRLDGKFVACMPGVPREMRPMLAEQLVPWLVARFDLRSAIYTKVLHTIGIGESELDRRVEELFRTLENPKIAMLAHGGRVDVKVMAKAQSREEADRVIEPVAAKLRTQIGAGYFGDDDLTIGGAILAQLVQRGRTLAVAESVTGGAIADELVSVPGASQGFLGGVVAYDNAVKRDLLGVRADTLSRVGAVSEEVAIEMARGVRAALHTDFSLATTGIAGPDGGSPEKPVGLVWFALVDEEGGVETYSRTFPGQRSDIRDRAAMTALSLLWRRMERNLTPT